MLDISGEIATSNGGEVAVKSVDTESRAEAEVGDKNSGWVLNGIFGVLSTTPSGESVSSTEENVLSRKYDFEDDVFVGGEKDKDPGQRKGKSTTNMLEPREHVMVTSTLTLLRRIYGSFRRRSTDSGSGESETQTSGRTGWVSGIICG